jgi:hypothetical protein
MTISEGRTLFQGAGLEGWTSGCLRHWSREGTAIVGTDGKVDPDNAGGRIETGDPLQRNYEFSARIRPISGILAQLHYRIAEKGRCWYTLDLEMETRTVSVSKVDMRPGGPGRVILHSVPMALEFGREYDARVVAEYSSLSAWLDGKPVCSLSDPGAPILAGQVGVAIWLAKAAFTEPRLRLLG